jgi:hypothetical protein
MSHSSPSHPAALGKLSAHHPPLEIGARAEFSPIRASSRFVWPRLACTGIVWEDDVQTKLIRRKEYENKDLRIELVIRTDELGV